MKCTPIIVITPKSATFAEADGDDGVKRSPILARRTPLVAGEGLKRTAPKPPRRCSPPGSVTEAVSMVLVGRKTVAAAARITGADPVSVEALAWETAKKQVHERDSGCCLACLAAGTDVHHRVRRVCGSSADPVIAFGFANTTLLCRPCHRKAHDVANPEMAARGYRLESWQSPEAEPLVLFSYAPGVTIWLTPAGEYATVPPKVGSRA
jgi:hypothetical protein